MVGGAGWGGCEHSWEAGAGESGCACGLLVDPQENGPAGPRLSFFFLPQEK